MIFQHPFPRRDRVVGFTQRHLCFGQRHQRMAVIVLRILGANFFQQRARLLRFLFAQQALAQVRPRVDVLGVPFQRGAVAGLGLVQLALLKIDITELGMVVRLVEMMYLRLEFLDPAPIIRARQLEAARS